MGTISVVIPSYNDAVFLNTCLVALAAQLRPADEIVVVDNASTDATAVVARAAGARVVYEPARGIWPAASAGYDAATGDVIARLDADSIPPADWLLRIEGRLDTSPDVDILTGPGDFYGCSALVRALGRTVYIGGYFWAIGLWLTSPPVFGSNFAMRRQVWLDARDVVHRDRNDVHDDLDFSIHLDPAVTVAYDRTLRVGISARPFDSWSGLKRRLTWAVRTLRLHWPEDSPVKRRVARRRRLRDARRYRVAPRA
ncbi:glycosyltransferase [Cryobacterium sp. Sr8]|uniref:glycosyltransferase family 2 protein n=1 Tax=Cryobacterium sp. Sr8 TaxID=1259203 RepID=UPI00106D530A|nr:glycosyltransferase family 2 protein [Cryobacterium sp. Sr8]TFD74292.1 glycosyltransferase [Cryobacterium sp. Sr8]